MRASGVSARSNSAKSSGARMDEPAKSDAKAASSVRLFASRKAASPAGIGMSTELVVSRIFVTREQARREIFEYLEMFKTAEGCGRIWATSCRRSSSVHPLG
jgi:hypothetical protein